MSKTGHRRRFRWDRRRGVYICPNNKVLHTTGTVHGGDMLRYARDMARRLMGTRRFLKSRDERKRVEMRFAHLKTHHGFERTAIRTHVASTSADVSNISMMRSGVVWVTMTPRRGRISTRPVTASCLRASRTGVREAPGSSWSASAPVSSIKSAPSCWRHRGSARATFPPGRVAAHPGHTVRYALTAHTTGHRGAGIGLTPPRSEHRGAVQRDRGTRQTGRRVPKADQYPRHRTDHLHRDGCGHRNRRCLAKGVISPHGLVWCQDKSRPGIAPSWARNPTAAIDTCACAFVQAAWVVLVKVKPARWESHGLKPWIEAAKKRLHRNVLAIAVANKLAHRLECSCPWSSLRGERAQAA